MKLENSVRRLAILMISAGLDLRRMWWAMRSVVPFARAYLLARKASRPEWPLHLSPVLGDRFQPAGSASGHYFHMDLWAAREVHSGNFSRLIDVGSRMDGYVAHVLTFRAIEVVDVRAVHSEVAGLSFVQADLTSPEPLPMGTADCVSSLHALEHFGLGRYGDRIDLDGWHSGLAGLRRLMAPGATLLLAVPVGRQRIEFDAHRVFHPKTILREAQRLGLQLQSFSGVDDSGAFHAKADMEAASQWDYGCGCFKFGLDAKAGA